MTLPLSENWLETAEIVDGEPRFKNFINGQWTSFDETKAITSPYDGRVVGHVPACPGEGIEAALAAASEARDTMRGMPAVERIELFNRAADLTETHRDLLADSLVAEAGKPRHGAESEVKATITRMRLVAEEARKIYGEYIPGDWAEKTMRKMSIVLREPRGVVLCVAPFNYPLFITASKVVPALLSGNTVVVKLPSADSITFLLFTRLLEQAGFPPGTVNVITPSGKELGGRVSDERIGAISFTGGTATGKAIAENAGMKHLHMELGGNGGAIVTGKADLGLAAACIAHGALSFSGQRCDAVGRVFATREVVEDLVRGLEEEFGNYRVGDPDLEDTDVGPLIDADAVERVRGLVEDAVERGAELLKGGGAEGNLFQPTLLTRVPLEARLMKEETFGPVLAVHPVADLDEAIEKANRHRYGLDSCVFTNDFYEAWETARSLKDGEVTINDYPSHGIGYFPFGGTRESGLGRQGIGYSIEEMTLLKTVVFNLEPGGMGKKPRLDDAG